MSKSLGMDRDLALYEADALTMEGRIFMRQAQEHLADAEQHMRLYWADWRSATNRMVGAAELRRSATDAKGSSDDR